MTTLNTTKTYAVAFIAGLLLTTACGPDDTPARPPGKDIGVDMTDMAADMVQDATEDMVSQDMVADSSEDMTVQDMDMAQDMVDMGPPDLCANNPCTETNRNICEQRGEVIICKCNDGFSDQNAQCVADPVCGVNTCTTPNRNVCEDVNGVAVCKCNEGYVERNGSCVLADPCDPSPCLEANRGQCSAGANQTAVCSCDPGFVDVDGSCQPENPCNNNPCQDPNKTVCTNTNGAATCSCDAGYQEDANGTCVDQDPCDPNPCTDANKTMCSVNAMQQAECSCDTGYQEDANGACVLIPPPMCTNQHSTGDMYEPDECISLATPFPMNTTQDHSIQPAGDVDFYRVTVQQGEIISLAETTSTDVYYTLYDTNGMTVLYNTGYETLLWEFDVAGTYYIKARHSSSSRTGNYSVTLTSLGQDDHGDTPATGTPITPTTGPMMGTFETRGDVDVFALNVDAGRILRFEETTNTDTYFTLYDTDGSTILRNTDNESWNWEFQQAGTYYVRVRNYSSTGLGGFNVNMIDLGFDDNGDTIAEATPITTSAPIVGNIETRGDHDYFAITIPNNHVYRFEETTSTDVYFTLYDTDGTTVLRNTDNEAWNWEFAGAGTYYIRIRHYSSTRVGPYNVTITDQGPDDHGDDAASATTIQTGQDITGRIETRGDRDVFSFTGQAGHIYQIEETTNTDIYQTLRDDQGNILRATDSESIRYEVSQDGVYKLEIRHYSSTRTGNYTIKVTDLGLDDHGDAPNEATAVMLPQTINGALETFQDRDVFAITTTQANQIIRMEETTNTDVTLTLYDTDGSTVLRSTTSEYINWQFPTAGTYYLSLRHNSTTRTGNYTIEFSSLGQDDHGDATMASPITTDGVAAMGAIEYTGDEDWFTFNTTSGQVYTINISGGSNWRATVYDSTGTNSIRSVRNGSMTLTLSANTTYLIRVYTTSTSSYGNYQLTVND